MSSAPLAGRFRRLIATIIDMILVPSLTLFLVMVFGIVEDAEDFTDQWWLLHVLGLAITSYLILNGYTLWKSGQTLGKLALGIAIVDAASKGGIVTKPRPAPLWKLVIIRAVFFPTLFMIIIPWFLLIPIIDQLLIFRSDRRCIHDWLSGTRVIRKI